ncbi:RNA polymerase sigma factor, partial [Singulisphaera rosea]
HRQHRCASRSVGREQHVFARPDDSAHLLVDRLVTADLTPRHHLIREERRERVHEALGRLSPTDREILVMRYLEDLTFPEIAGILDITESAGKMRHLRAIERVRSVLADDSGSAS